MPGKRKRGSSKKSQKGKECQQIAKKTANFRARALRQIKILEDWLKEQPETKNQSFISKSEATLVDAIRKNAVSDKGVVSELDTKALLKVISHVFNRKDSPILNGKNARPLALVPEAFQVQHALRRLERLDAQAAGKEFTERRAQLINGLSEDEASKRYKEWGSDLIRRAKVQKAVDDAEKPAKEQKAAKKQRPSKKAKDDQPKKRKVAAKSSTLQKTVTHPRGRVRATEDARGAFDDEDLE